MVLIFRIIQIEEEKKKIEEEDLKLVLSNDDDDDEDEDGKYGPRQIKGDRISLFSTKAKQGNWKILLFWGLFFAFLSFRW